MTISMEIRPPRANVAIPVALDGETLRVVRAADGSADHLNLGTFVFTREPYDQAAPPAATPDPGGWRAGAAPADKAR